MDINNFDIWFSILDWDCSTDEMVEKIYTAAVQKPIAERPKSKAVLVPQTIRMFKNTYEKNIILLKEKLHPRVRELGEKHQAMITKLIRKLEETK